MACPKGKLIERYTYTFVYTREKQLHFERSKGSPKSPDLSKEPGELFGNESPEGEQQQPQPTRREFLQYSAIAPGVVAFFSTSFENEKWRKEDVELVASDNFQIQVPASCRIGRPNRSPRPIIKELDIFNQSAKDRSFRIRRAIDQLSLTVELHGTDLFRCCRETCQCARQHCVCVEFNQHGVCTETECFCLDCVQECHWALRPSKQGGHIAIVFPPQHILEIYVDPDPDAHDPPDKILKTALGQESRIVFRLPPDANSIPLTLNSLLDWSKHKLSVVPTAVPNLSLIHI